SNFARSSHEDRNFGVKRLVSEPKEIVIIGVHPDKYDVAHQQNVKSSATLQLGRTFPYCYRSFEGSISVDAELDSDNLFIGETFSVKAKICNGSTDAEIRMVKIMLKQKGSAETESFNNTISNDCVVEQTFQLNMKKGEKEMVFEVIIPSANY